MELASRCASRLAPRASTWRRRTRVAEVDIVAEIPAMGSTRFWVALREYVAAHRHQLSDERTLLTWLDGRTAMSLGSSIFAPRFPSIY